MKLIKPSYKIITPINGEEILKHIELASRDCYQSDGKIEYSNTWRQQEDTLIDNTNGYFAKSARVLIPKLMNLNHEAMLEFGGMIHVRFIVDRGVSHELVRHRIASFAQESTRYCNYGKDEHITFIAPEWLLDVDVDAINDGDWSNCDEDAKQYASCLFKAESTYNYLLKCVNKWTPQEARSVLPNSLKTTINISCNIREWRHIMRLRTAKAAHPQMREVMCPLLDEFKQLIPILFDDINY